MKLSLVGFTILLVFNYQAFSIDAPTTGDFGLFYPMIHGFVRGAVEWEVTKTNTSFPFNSFMDPFMAEVNSTLICIHANPHFHLVYQQFIGLFANISVLEPFDIRNISPGTSSDYIYNMILNAYSVASKCLASHPIGPEIAILIQNTTSHIVFEMIYALSANYSSAANTYLNLIIPYYFDHTYEEMGYYMFQLSLLAMNAAHLLPPSPTLRTVQSPSTTIPESYNVTIPILSIIDEIEVRYIYVYANISFNSGNYLSSRYSFKLFSNTKYPDYECYKITFSNRITNPITLIKLEIYAYSPSYSLLMGTTRIIKV